MRALEVTVLALPPVAEELLRFAAAVEPVPSVEVDGELQAALDEFLSWCWDAQQGLAAEARRAAGDVMAAARVYADLERLLIGGVRR